MGKVIEHQDYLVLKVLIFRMTRNAFTVFLELADADFSLAEVLEKFNIALGKAKFIVGQFEVLNNIMGCEFYRMGSQMSSMPILDTCTEVTLVILVGGRGGNLNCLR
jgi:DNA polymerase-3 subunit alpha